MNARKIRELVAWLDRIDQGETTLESLQRSDPEVGKELAELLKTVSAVRRTADVSPSETFRSGARFRLLNRVAARFPAQRAEPVPGPQAALIPGLRRVFFGLAVAVGILLIGVLGSIPVQNALPGDALYPGKLGLESLQLLASPAAEDAILQSRFASNRLTEIQLLIVQGRYDDVDAAVRRYEDNIDRAVLALTEVARDDGGQTYPILKRIEMDLDGYATTLAELMAFVPGETQIVLARAIDASHLWSGN
jgi:hypothetical protein